ncbi:MAG: carboxypeptidase regulatory-like domain-containing protein, partial [Gammaproteobacteria bacterium]
MKLVRLLALSVLGLDLMAQVTTATFYGIVTDSTGATVPGASVTLLHEETNATQSRPTDTSGEFVFNFLRVGRYTLRIEARGFKKFENPGIELVGAQNVRQTYSLEVGALTETVKVEGSTSLVNTVSAEQLQTFDVLKVTELPLGRRNFSSLLRINTGVTMTGDGPRMNGVGRNGTAYAVDGTDASANPEGRQAATYGGANYIDIMSIEAIQEVHTIKGVIPAEYSNVTGGQVNLLSRSGTNNWHGTAFENFQAENLNARNQILATKPGTTFNQFGASAGGPIRKDKIFIFGVYEGYRERAAQAVQANVFTASARQRILSAVPAFGILLDHVPLPNQPAGANPDIGLFLEPKSNARTDNHAVIKGDISLGSTRQLALTYTRGRPYRLLPRYYTNKSNDRDWQIYQERGTASYTMGGSNWTSESRFGFNLSDANRIDKLFITPPPGPKEEIDFGRRTPRLQTTFGFGTDDIELYLIEGRTWNIDQKYARHLGQHSLKLGGNYSYHCCQRNNPEGTDI